MKRFLLIFCITLFPLLHAEIPKHNNNDDKEKELLMRFINLYTGRKGCISSTRRTEWESVINHSMLGKKAVTQTIGALLKTYRSLEKIEALYDSTECYEDVTNIDTVMTKLLKRKLDPLHQELEVLTSKQENVYPQSTISLGELAFHMELD